MKNIGRIFWKKFRRMDQLAENDKTERVTGLGRKTRKEIVKRTQMTALRFHTGGDNRHPRPPFVGDYWAGLLISHTCVHMMHYNLKGHAVNPHCGSPGCTVGLIFGGETEKMNNYRSWRNQSLAEDRLLCDGRVIWLVWFPDTKLQCCV